MAISMNQAIIPLAAVGTMDETSLTPGDHFAYAALLVAQVQASRALGQLCRARVYVSPDVAARMYGSSWPLLLDFGEWNSPLSMQAYSSEMERLEVFADLTLPANTLRIE